MEGRSKITSDEENDGAPVGDHYVSVTRITGPGTSAPDGTNKFMSLSGIAPPGAEKGEDPDLGTVCLVPGKYINARTSGLKITVPDGGSSELHLKLSVC